MAAPVVLGDYRTDDVAYHGDGTLQLKLGIASKRLGSGAKFRHGLAALQDNHTLPGCADAG